MGTKRNNIIRSMLTLCVSLLLVNITWAQQKKQDIRPLKNLNNSHIPKYSSYEEYLLSKSAKNLVDAKKVLKGTKIRKNQLSSTQLQLVHSSSQNKSVFGTNKNDSKLIKAENGSVKWLDGNLGTIPKSKISSLDDYAVNALEILDNYSRTLGLVDPKNELVSSSVQKDELGYIHIKYQQIRNSIPVWGSELYAHVNASGMLYTVNGNYGKTAQVNVDVPSLSDVEALALVQSDLEARKRWKPVTGNTAKLLGLDKKTSELVYYPLSDGTLVLAYEVALHPNLLEHFTYLIDAKSGEVLNRIKESCSFRYDKDAATKEVHYSEPVIGNLKTTARAGSFTDASGTDLNGVNQNFRVFQDEEGTYYNLWDLPNLDEENSTFPNDLAGGGMTLNAIDGDEDNVDHITSDDNSWLDASGISAHVNMNIAYNYFNSNFSRKAIDDNDKTIISVVNVKDDGEEMDNAFWSGDVIYYGNGRDYFEPFAGALDVAGHEMSHGVVEYTADLIYQFQPGALNESFADIFGVLIEDEDYLIGEDISQENYGIAIRDLLNPDNSELPDPQPAHMDDYVNLTIDEDEGGVHINSGIPNRAAALIIEAVGKEKAGKIYYRALASYLTRNSNFGEARLAVQKATIDLYGEAEELVAVKESFDAVGITEEMANDGTGNDVSPVEGGASVITFMDEFGTVGLSDISDPENVETIFFEAYARADFDFGSYSQLTTPLDGETIWYVGYDGYLEMIELETGEVYYFPDVYIEEEGDLWNASISADGETVALVSAYEGDPNLYLYDGEEIGYIELIPEVPEGGVEGSPIEYPEIVSWSTNIEEPKIAFDALHYEVILNDTIGYWGIYEIDFSTEKIFNLIPNQTSELNVGNINYSRTNPDIIAYNVFDFDNGEMDITLVDFEEDEVLDLNITSIDFNGASITDAERPAFSPNDDYLVFNSTEFMGLFFLDLENGDLEFLDMDEPVYAQNWFVYGAGEPTGTEEEEETVPKQFVLNNNYPNPFNPSTQISFEIPNSEHVRLEVFDALGRKISTLINAPMVTGKHSVTFNAGGLPSGLYIARLTAGTSSSIKKMMLIK